MWSFCVFVCRLGIFEVNVSEVAEAVPMFAAFACTVTAQAEIYFAGAAVSKDVVLNVWFITAVA